MKGLSIYGNAVLNLIATGIGSRSRYGILTLLEGDNGGKGCSFIISWPFRLIEAELSLSSFSILYYEIVSSLSVTGLEGIAVSIGFYPLSLDIYWGRIGEGLGRSKG